MWILLSEANLIKPRFPNSTVLYILFLPVCPFWLIPPGNLSIGRSKACLPCLSLSLIRSECRRRAFQASGIDCKLVVVVGGSGGSNWIETSATGSWKTVRKQSAAPALAMYRIAERFGWCFLALSYYTWYSSAVGGVAYGETRHTSTRRVPLLPIRYKWNSSRELPPGNKC